MCAMKYFLPPGALAGCLLAFFGIPQSGTAQSAATWTWIGGSSAADQPGIYGQLEMPAMENIPPGRWDAARWTDNSGNFWLFGGSGYAAATNTTGVLLNDLWKYIPSSNEWVWMGGSNSPGTQSPGVYGTLGTAATGNIPGSRTGAVSWTDSSGNLWLFGGSGLDASGNPGSLNDLWKYSPTAKEWSWMGGSLTASQPGVYGTLGMPATGNIPGGRFEAVKWTDASGNLWLFGGTGLDAGGNAGSLNDLWMYSPTAKEWTWMGGSSTVNQPGIYGTLGTASAGNISGGRFGAVSWTDTSGNVWLFGGNGIGADGNFTALNDLWALKLSTLKWAWMGGSTTSAGCVTNNLGLLICGGQPGVYGTLGTAAAGNVPGGRAGAVSWIDSGGNFWFFGGEGYDSAGNQGYLNDLWKFNPDADDWTWMGGDSTDPNCGPAPGGNTLCVGQYGVYGTLGVADSTNVPGARTGALGWSDSTNNLWFFGGYGVASAGSIGVLNDLWEYQPATTAPPDFSIAASPKSLTVTAGQSGTVAITVTSLNGFNTAVTFSCSGLPSGTSCNFSPASVTPQFAPVSSTLTITTSGTTVAAGQTSSLMFLAAVVAPLLCSLGWKKRRSLQLIVLLAMSGVGLSLLCGCASVTLNGSQSITAIVTVTATSGSLQHTASLTLMVD